MVQRTTVKYTSHEGLSSGVSRQQLSPQLPGQYPGLCLLATGVMALHGYNNQLRNYSHSLCSICHLYIMNLQSCCLFPGIPDQVIITYHPFLSLQWGGGRLRVLCSPSVHTIHPWLHSLAPHPFRGPTGRACGGEFAELLSPSLPLHHCDLFNIHKWL